MKRKTPEELALNLMAHTEEIGEVKEESLVRGAKLRKSGDFRLDFRYIF